MHRKLERAVIEPIHSVRPRRHDASEAFPPDIPFYLRHGEHDGAVDSVPNAIMLQISHIECDDRTILGHGDGVYGQHIKTKKRTKKRCVSGVPYSMRCHCCSTIGFDSELYAVG